MKSNDQNMEPILSVWMITYNHAIFIKNAIESVINQKTKFYFDLVIGEDCSTDETAKIIESYAKKYPKIIKARFNNKNIGMSQNMLLTLNECNGKYIAMIEGDDEWTDTNKLQKQVDFLEKNRDVVLTCHRYQIKNEHGINHDFNSQCLLEHNRTGVLFNNKVNFESWVTKPVTLVFRRETLDIPRLRQYNYTRDIHLVFHLLEKGPGYLMNFIGAIYNEHSTGVWTSQHTHEKVKTSMLVYSELFRINNNSVSLKNIYIETARHFFRHTKIPPLSTFNRGLISESFSLLRTLDFFLILRHFFIGYIKNYLSRILFQ